MASCKEAIYVTAKKAVNFHRILSNYQFTINFSEMILTMRLFVVKKKTLKRLKQDIRNKNVS